MSVPSQIADLRFPVILWRKCYSYVARTPLELCTHPRRLLADTEERSKRGEFSLLDSAGRVYSVSGFAQIAPFGGLMRFAHFILRSAYAAPVLGAPVAPPIAEFKETLARAVQLRFRDALLKGMNSLDSPAAAVALAERLDRRAAP